MTSTDLHPLLDRVRTDAPDEVLALLAALLQALIEVNHEHSRL